MTSPSNLSKIYNYNYYPRTMTSLCEIAYHTIDSIKEKVWTELGLNVVWGPVRLTSKLGIIKSLMYVAHKADTNEYIVVIRGTTLDSWDSWTQEDFKIGPPLRRFNTLAPRAPVTAYISQGSYNGMEYLIGLKDPVSKKDVVSYLKGLRNYKLYVTGHSLGGTLTPPMFAYLNDQIYGGGYVTNMALWSFAGLTAGDVGFNHYFNKLFNPKFPWRVHNDLDIAPFCWNAQKSIENIYKSQNLKWGFPEDDFIKLLFKEGAGLGYGQPLGDQELKGIFDTSFPDDDLWVVQAMHQHHVATYKKLVDAFYPKIF